MRVAPKEAREDDPLLTSLAGMPEIKNSGYSVEGEEEGAIVLSRRSHAIGLWQCNGGRYSYTPVARNEPTFVTVSLAEAVQHSLQLIGLRVDR